MTDAALVLGMIPAAEIAGDVPLVRELAERALARLAEPLGFDSVTEVACGVIRIVAAQMADAIRSVTIERGRDPREAALVAFGGAGPLFGTLLADELGVEHGRVPPYAGNFSAVGLLGADLARSASRTRVTRLVSRGADRGGRRSRSSCSPSSTRAARASRGEAIREVHMDIRFVGQEHTLTVPVPAPGRRGRASTRSRSPSAFLDEYERTFGSILDEELEIVCVRAIATTPLERTPRRPRPTGTTATARARRGTVQAWSFTGGGLTEFAVVDRSSSAAARSSTGRRSCASRRATTYVDRGYRATVHPGGSLLIDQGR